MDCHPQIKARAGPQAPPSQRRSGHSPPASVPSRLKILLLLLLLPRCRELTISPLLHPGVMPACSRWLSGATPPEPDAREFRTPAGVPAIHGTAVPLRPRITHHASFPKNTTKTREISLFTTLTQPRTHRKQATRHARASLRWWTKSRCDFVCLRSRHFVAWLRRGLAHDAMAIQTTHLSQCFTQLNA